VDRNSCAVDELRRVPGSGRRSATEAGLRRFGPGRLDDVKERRPLGSGGDCGSYASCSHLDGIGLFAEPAGFAVVAGLITA
jgi:hypothetical protein